MSIERGLSPEEMGIKQEVAKPEARKESEINEQLQNLKEGLKSMEGPEMRKILDKEFELNSVQSPIDSTDPNRRVEYDDWKRTLYDSRRATQELKSDLERRIEARKAEISKIESEQK